jgi:hypothetical protein
MQFSALYGAVQDIAGDSNSTARCKIWVNAAYHDILSRRTWSFLETTMSVTLTSAQLEYVLTGTTPVVTDFGGNISVTVNLGTASPSSQWKKLRFLDQQTFDDWLAHTIATTGIPAFYTIYGATSPTASAASVKSGGETRLAVWPTPNAALTAKVRYPRAADSVELSADTDVPIIPVRHHYTLVLKAAALGLAEEDQAAQAQLYNQMAEQRVAAMVTEDERMRFMDNQRGTDAAQVHTQSVAQPSPASHAPDQRTYPAPVVGA